MIDLLTEQDTKKLVKFYSRHLIITIKFVRNVFIPRLVQAYMSDNTFPCCKLSTDYTYWLYNHATYLRTHNLNKKTMLAIKSHYNINYFYIALCVFALLLVCLFCYFFYIFVFSLCLAFCYHFLRFACQHEQQQINKKL